MSAFHATVLRWANERLDALLGVPPMWGSNEAVEMQALLLLELRALALRPDESDASPDAVFGLYTAFLRQRFPERGPAPLCEIEGAPFQETLDEFRRLLDRRILAEDPFQHADLVIRLAYKPESRPTAQSFTGACDDVRRAIRAFARSADKKTGRVRKDVEALTDFSLRDVRLTQPNGAPADAWLLLERGAAPQTDLFALDEVRAALSSLASTATWLESGEDVSALPIDDNDARVRAAVQTMRLLPRRDVALVEIGGSLAGGPKPFVLRASHQVRCVSILAAQSAPRAFDETDEIRGIALDRGTIVLGKRRRMTCYVPSALLGTEVREVGVRSRVRGQMYAPPLSPPFVMAESIEVEEGEARRGG
jgi:hypothetical protein